MDEVTEEETPKEEESGPEPQDSKEVRELKEKLATTHERLLRTAADLDNLRKRTKRDLEDAVNRGRTEVLQEILLVIDSVDLALTSADPKGTAEGIIEGVKMIQKQFLTATERFKLKAVETEGRAFDPSYHEAVAQLASPEHPVGMIVSEMRKGYLLGDRLLRPAMVVVSKGGSESALSDEDRTKAGHERDEATEDATPDTEAVATVSEPAPPAQAPAATEESE